MAINIVPFHEIYAKAFYDLNIEWLETHFYVEDYDKEVLSKPEHHILEPGGHIFFAIEDDRVLGTVALLHRGEDVFELTKMAVLLSERGSGIGKQLMQYCLDFAKSENFEGLYLYSNTLLENAIHIYRKFGFVEVPIPEDNPYHRSNIKMDYSLT
jgi:N-acetylglutamate synthase-like GNAT family acetyltransferase